MASWVVSDGNFKRSCPIHGNCIQNWDPTQQPDSDQLATKQTGSGPKDPSALMKTPRFERNAQIHNSYLVGGKTMVKKCPSEPSRLHAVTLKNNNWAQASPASDWFILMNLHPTSHHQPEFKDHTKWAHFEKNNSNRQIIVQIHGLDFFAGSKPPNVQQRSLKMLPGFAFSSLFLGDHKRKPPRYPWFSHGFPISWSFWWNRPFCPGFFHWNPWDTRGFRSQPASERGLAGKSARCLEATTGGLGSHQLLCCGDHMIMGFFNMAMSNKKTISSLFGCQRFWMVRIL